MAEIHREQSRGGQNQAQSVPNEAREEEDRKDRNGSPSHSEVRCWEKQCALALTVVAFASNRHGGCQMMDKGVLIIWPMTGLSESGHQNR